MDKVVLDLGKKIEIQDVNVSEFHVHRGGSVVPYYITIPFKHLGADGINLVYSIIEGSNLWDEVKSWARNYLAEWGLDVDVYRMKLVPAFGSNTLPSIQFEVLPDTSLD